MSANHVFGVDDNMSTITITITGDGVYPVPAAGSLYVSQSPAGFLAGRATGPALSTQSWSFDYLAAKFDVPIAVSPSGTSFTLSPASVTDVVGGGYVPALGEAIGFDIAPTATSSGTIYPGLGLWELSYTSTTSFGSVGVYLAGTIE